MTFAFGLLQADRAIHLTRTDRGRGRLPIANAKTPNLQPKEAGPTCLWGSLYPPLQKLLVRFSHGGLEKIPHISGISFHFFLDRLLFSLLCSRHPRASFYHLWMGNQEDNISSERDKEVIEVTFHSTPRKSRPPGWGWRIPHNPERKPGKYTEQELEVKKLAASKSRQIQEISEKR